MIDIEALRAAVADGLVKAIPGPDGLTLYNYSEQCVWAKAWTPTTRAARGLVLSADGQIIARPWPKFFNLGEVEETYPENLPAEVPELAEKLDGSLIIVFWNPYASRWTAITRGAWDSEQARWANEWLANNWQPGPKHDAGRTYMFELTAPWNRIVVHYPDVRMTLLGYTYNATGADVPYAAARILAGLLGARAINYQDRPVDEIDLTAEVANAEGFVARYSNGLRVKLKYRHYIAMHKILTGLSVKGIWEILSEGRAPDLTGVPDEFMGWYNAQVDGLNDQYNEIAGDVLRTFDAGGWREKSRKDCALAWAGLPGPVKASLFRLLDGKPFGDIVWKAIKPSGAIVFSKGEA